MKQRSWFILGLLIAGCLLLSACIPGGGGVCGGTPQGGWSSLVAADGILYMGSMQGEILAINPISRSAGYSFPQESEGEWRFPLAGGAGGGFLTCAPVATVSLYGSPVVADGVVYVGTGTGKVYALNATAGYDIWEFPRDAYIGSIVGSLVLDRGILYVGSCDGKLYAIDIETRRLAWDSPFATGGEIWATPLVHDGVVYFGSLDHKIYALDADTGEPVWESPFETGGAIAATPLFYNNTLYIGSFDRRFYAIDASTGKAKEGFTPFQADNWFWGKAVVYNDTIIAGCLDHRVYALSAENGTKVWDYETGGPIRGDPALCGDLVIFGAEDGTVYALEAGSGAERWRRALEPATQIRASLYAEDGVVYVHAANQKLYALEIENGTVLWSFAPGD